MVVCGYAWDNCYPDSRIGIANADGSGLTLVATAGGFTYREAAEVLRVPDGTVKSRVFQARVRLTAWRETRSAGEL